MKALITGASSGIGREIAKYLASKGYNLIITARSYDKLASLKKEISNVDVRIITADLANEEEVYSLYEQVKSENIDFLVNNAGFGAYGKFADVLLEKEIELINTNITAVHILTKLFVKDMIAKNSGYILNLGSSAGFLAGPTFSSYYASKNYVVRLTQAIHEELRRDKINVKVSALCPGPVKTNFDNIANVKFNIKMLDAEYVAKYAVEKTLKGKMIIIPGFSMKFIKFMQHFAGETLITRVSYNMQKRKSGK